jgi:hypothetical protein
MTKTVLYTFCEQKGVSIQGDRDGR